MKAYYINTSRGYYDVTDKIINEGYKYINDNFLVNPQPMTFDYKELQWLKDNIYEFVKKSYSAISKEILDEIKTIKIDEIKSRPYIFTSYSYGFAEDIFLLKIKDTTDNVYNIYMVKYQTMEGVYNNHELVNHELVNKVRFENEEWYRNFFSNEEEYDKNKYSDNKTEITKENIINKSKFSTVVEDEGVYKTFEGKNYTYAEWKKFEEEQYKIYKDKRRKKGFWDNFFG